MLLRRSVYTIVMNNNLNKIIRIFASLLGQQQKRETRFAPTEGYDEYLSAQEEAYASMNDRKPDWELLPFFSVILLYKGNKASLNRTINSLQNQSYDNWELIICAQTKVICGLKDMEKDHIRLCGLDSTDEAILHAAVAKSHGHYLWFAQAGDEFTKDALYCMAENAAKHKDVGMIYGDEDHIGPSGQRERPIFKPDFSPETLFSHPYIGRAFAVSRSAYNNADGLASYSAADIYAFQLKCAKNGFVKHIPKVIFSSAQSNCPLSPREGRDCLDKFIKSHYKNGYSVSGLYTGSFRVRYGFKDNLSIAIIIPHRDQTDALRACLESIEDISTYERYQFIIVDYGSQKPISQKYLNILEKNRAAKVIRYDGKFNLSKINNIGAANALTDYLTFLSPYCRPITPDWLESMLELAQLKDTGVVGAKLLFPSGQIWHGGVVVGIGGWFGNVYSGDADDTDETRRNHFVQTLRNTTAVSGNCLMVKNDKFFHAGCFDETLEAYGYDVELCMRMRNFGWRNIYTPFSTLEYHGGKVSSKDAAQPDLVRCYDAMRKMLLKGDPYYNPNFDYAKIIPVVAPKPYPAILLNPNTAK